jgi:hypothetical protein
MADYFEILERELWERSKARRDETPELLQAGYLHSMYLFLNTLSQFEGLLRG